MNLGGIWQVNSLPPRKVKKNVPWLVGSSSNKEYYYYYYLKKIMFQKEKEKEKDR